MPLWSHIFLCTYTISTVYEVLSKDTALSAVNWHYYNPFHSPEKEEATNVWANPAFGFIFLKTSQLWWCSAVFPFFVRKFHFNKEFDINGILQYYFLEGENIVLPCPYLWLQKAKQSLTSSCFPLVFRYLSLCFESSSAPQKTSHLYSLKFKFQSRNKDPNFHCWTTALHNLSTVQRSF